MKEWLQKKLINILVRNLFNAITERDILLIDGKGQWRYKNKKLTEDTIQRLKDDADTFANSTLWKILTDEVRYKANQRMFETSNNTYDLLAGKMLLYAIDIIKSKINNIKKF